MSTTSLKLLRSKMTEKFGFRYILTHRLNQDCLEKFFCQVRGRSDPHDHPTPVECLQRIKVIMLGKDPSIALHNHSNTIERDPEEYVSAIFMKALSENNPATKILSEQNLTNPQNDIGISDWPVEYLEEGYMENDQIPDNYSDDSIKWPVEYLEDCSIEQEQEVFDIENFAGCGWK